MNALFDRLANELALRATLDQLRDVHTDEELAALGDDVLHELLGAPARADVEDRGSQTTRPT